MSRKPKYTTEQFLNLLYNKYDKDFDFSDCVYINNVCSIQYRCNGCSQSHKSNAWNLLNPKNYIRCKVCNPDIKKLNTEKFIKIAQEVHGDLYDYTDTVYLNAKTKVTIKCNKCQQYFSQRTTAHLYNRSGCPSCKISHGEKRIEEELKSRKIGFIKQKTFENLIGIGGKHLRFDFYLPDKNICIEYDGKQHSDKKSNYWSETLIQNDNIKNKYCEERNIKLIRIDYLFFDKISSIISEICAIAPLP